MAVGVLPDVCVRYLTEDGGTRITVVLLSGAVETARARHHSSPVATVALGRAMVCGALLAGTVRPEGRINLQLVGKGPLGSLGVDAAGNGNVRAYLRRPQVPLPVEGAGRISTALGVGREGEVHVLMDPAGGQYSRGTSPLLSGEVDEDVEAYLHMSMQLRTCVGAEVLLDDARRVALATGVQVESLPGDNAEGVSAARARIARGGLHDLVAPHLPLQPDKLVDLVLSGATARRMDARPLRWFCPCSKDRVIAALATLGSAEIQDMIAKEGRADVSCDFCRQEYPITGDELRELLADMSEMHPSGMTQQ